MVEELGNLEALANQLKDGFNITSINKAKQLVEKLGADNVGKLLQKADIINKADGDVIRLLDDIADTPDFAKHIDDLTEDIVAAWKLLKNSIGKKTSFAKDFDVLQTLGKVLKSDELVSLFDHPKIGGIQNFLKAYNDVRCATCPDTGGYKAYMPMLHEIIDNTTYCLKEFGDKMDSKMFGQELLTRNFRGRDGIQHMFKDMREKGYKAEDVSSLGGKFDTSDNFFDLKFVNGKTLKYIEYKSYLPDGFGTKEHIKQFKEYLKDITDLTELNYVFNVSKADELVWKNKFKKIFKNNVDDIWKEKGDLFRGKKIKLEGKEIEITKNNFKQILEHKDVLKTFIFDFVKTN
ncbi:hypothetical protein [Aquimarina sediminis]|uniref:hypothetical protein n=1 Tax=Aquimarina sediminis TaxID=2070536 RepID=UPI000CA046D7|nr:hypothetical protein [Aquimarina sediminis]